VKESLDLIGYKIVAGRRIAQDRHVFQFIAEPVDLHVISSEAVARFDNEVTLVQNKVSKRRFFVHFHELCEKSTCSKFLESPEKDSCSVFFADSGAKDFLLIQILFLRRFRTAEVECEFLIEYIVYLYG